MPLYQHPAGKDWRIAVIRNKYPAVEENGVPSHTFARGIYPVRTGVGTHNLLITRAHTLHFTELPAEDAAALFAVLQRFHRIAAQDDRVRYIASFYNYGPSAGASVWHPHYQMLALPVIPEHVARSLKGSERYFKSHGRCVRCDIIRAERSARARIIVENSHAIAMAPYASKKPFEMSILPKRHTPSLRDTPPAALRGIALLAQEAAKAMKRRLGDPDFNFFIHDAPLGSGDYRHHHWHIEMVPRVTTEAGFELSTSIIINVIDPDNAAAILRGEK